MAYQREEFNLMRLYSVNQSVDRYLFTKSCSPNFNFCFKNTYSFSYRVLKARMPSGVFWLYFMLTSDIQISPAPLRLMNSNGNKAEDY